MRLTPLSRELAFGAFGATAALAVLALSSDPAPAESSYCSDLRALIAHAGDGGGAHDRAAANKLQNEIAHAESSAHATGCDRQQFLFFGSPPPPQCGAINARINQMRARLYALEQRVGGEDNRKQTLIARYDSQCRAQPANAGPRNFLEELFGVRPAQPLPPPQEVPTEPDRPSMAEPETVEDDRPTGGNEAVCVRRCDGGFFPVSYSARRSNLDELGELCKALCPGAEADLYTKGQWRDIETAVSADGEPYTSHPNASKFEKTRDPSCSCKPPDKSWVEALGDAERILASSHAHDTVVTPEQAERMSRPLASGGSSARALNRRQAAPAREPQTVEAAPPQDAGAGPDGDGLRGSVAPSQSEFRDVVGPDGVKRRVRVVAPAL